MFAALTERYRGQKGLGAKQVEVLGFFTETARLKGVGQTTMSGGGGSPPTMTREKNVEAVFKLKAAPDSPTSTLVAGYGPINASRMMKHVLNRKDVPDQQKVALCAGRTAADPTKWLDEYRAKQSAQPPDDAGKTLDASEFEALAPAEKNARKRQQICEASEATGFSRLVLLSQSVRVNNDAEWKFRRFWWCCAPPRKRINFRV